MKCGNCGRDIAGKRLPRSKAVWGVCDCAEGGILTVEGVVPGGHEDFDVFRAELTEALGIDRPKAGAPAKKLAKSGAKKSGSGK